MRAREYKKRMIVAVTAGIVAALAVYMSIDKLNKRIEKQNATIQSLTQDLNNTTKIDSMLSSKNSSKYQYVVAKTKIIKGQKITSDMLELKEFDFQQADVSSNTDALINKIAKNNIEIGNAITNSSVINEDSIVFNLENGMRAVNIPISYIQGIASYIKPGSRVDVVSSQKDLNGKDRNILQNAMVLDIEKNKSLSGTSGSSAPTAVVLKVPASSTSKIVDAMADGKLILFARSANDNVVTRKRVRRYRPSIPENLDIGNLYLPAPAMPKAPSPKQQIELIQAGSKSQVTFEGE